MIPSNSIFHGSKSQDELVQALSSSTNLIEYLHVDKEIQKLSTQVKNHPSHPTVLAYHRWSIVCLKIESACLYCFYRVISSSKNFLSRYFSNITGLQVSIKHRFLQNEKEKIQNIFQRSLLVSSINAHQPKSSDFYLHPNIFLRLRNFENGDFKFSSTAPKNFFMEKGLCDGMCSWFTYLYFKTVADFSDSEAQLCAIARLFENGAPRQAEILQLIQGDGSDVRECILGLEIETKDRAASLKDLNLLSIQALSKKDAQSSQYLHSLPVGVYSVSLAIDHDATGYHIATAHALRYFKINENLGFIWDPNVGLIKLDKDLSEELLKCARLLRNIKEDSYFIFRQIKPQDERTPPTKTYTISVED